MPAEREVIIRIGAEINELEEATLKSRQMLRQWTEEVKKGSMTLALYGRAAGEQIKKGLDPTGLQVGVDKATIAWTGFFQQLKGNLGILPQINTQIVDSGKKFQMAFGGRPRFTALSTLSSQLSYLSSDLVGVSGNTRLATGMFSMMQSGAMALGTAMPYVLGGTVALAGAFIAIKSATYESSKAFENYRKNLKETREEQKRLTADLENYKEGTIRYNSVIFGLIGSIIGWGKAAEYASKQTAKWHEDFEPFNKELEDSIKLLKIQNAILKSESVPNIQALVDYYQRQYDALSKIKPELGAQTEHYKKLNESLRNLKDAQNDLAEAAERAREAMKPYVYKEEWRPFSQEQYNKMLKFSEGTREFYKKQEDWERNLAMLQRTNADEYIKVLKERLEFLEMIGEEWSEEYNQIWDKIKNIEKNSLKDQERELTKHQQVVLGYVNQMSQGFANAFAGIETDWGRMLQNMVAQFAQVALSSLIMSILFPGTPFMKFFKTGMGFQHGTPFVEKTGMYMLHRGEAVTPASRNISYVRNYNTGGAMNTYYLINLDVDKLTRNQIVPMIEQMARNRQTRILTV